MLQASENTLDSPSKSLHWKQVGNSSKPPQPLTHHIDHLNSYLIPLNGIVNTNNINNVITPQSTSSTSLSITGVTCNPNFGKLASGYLFHKVGRRCTVYLAENPDDTTIPIPPHILSGLVKGASKLGTKKGYSSYGHQQLLHIDNKTIIPCTTPWRISPII